MPAPSSDLPHPRSLAGHLVVFTGKLGTLGRRDARALAVRLGAETADEVTSKTTLLVVGVEGLAARDKSHKLRRAEELNAQGAAIAIVSESEFCRLTGQPTPEALRRQFHAMRDLLARYRALREDHLRYLIKCGIVRAAHRTNADIFFSFPEVAAVREANAALEQGATFRAVVRALSAAREGQLTLDFRLDAAPAKLIELRRPSRPAPGGAPAAALRDTAAAEACFRAASALDDGDLAQLEEAAAHYRKALEHDPYLVAALINLANIHYSRDELAEAQALYERAIGLEPEFFEAHFNLGNIYHDLGSFAEAQACYREALRLNPFYADAHFYLAITFEKLGQSQEARPHWRAYQQLAPQGEWVALAREFSE
ncbi:MAG: tetratricopeptide repeat protein [Acidobacteria bacterium]|nr:tetratricopeptide repeat protein [Acidobacteriota bacterium]